MNLWPMEILLITVYRHVFDQLAERNKPMLTVEQSQQKRIVALVLQRALCLALALQLTLHLLPGRLWALQSDAGPPTKTTALVQP